MFYKTGVDIANTKQMWNFLKNHYTYYTMNSWNVTRSIANNVKLYKLNLSGDWYTALQFLSDEADVGGLQYLIRELCDDFEAEFSNYEVGFNGRSGGYLVLYQKGNNKSALPDFVDNYDTYEDFKSEIRGYYGDRVKDYLRELRDMVRVVRAFDLLCDQLRDLVDHYSKMSYADQVLAQTVESFNDNYHDDLATLGCNPLVVTDQGVDFTELTLLNCLKEAFLQLFAGHNLVIKDNILRIKED